MSAPAASVILPTDCWQTILPVCEALASLKCASRLEVVIVAPSRALQGIDGRILEQFNGRQIVPLDPIIPLGDARAAGVRAATSEIVFIGETHSFPREGMFEALIAAHSRGATMAVPAFENSNPDGPVSWAGFITGYASWTGGPASLISSAPTFNVSYRRTFLVGLGDHLERAMTEGEDMIGLLHAGGHEIRFEPGARIAHANISSAGPWLHQRFLAGRVIAGNRSRGWTIARRAFYAATSPLIPAVLLRRNGEGIRRTARSAGRRGTMPMLVVGLVAQAAGELAGYLAGSDAATRDRYDDFEIRRLMFVRDSGRVA